MTAALAATVAALLIVAVGLAVLALVTVAPYVVTVTLAERRGCGTARWAAVSAACSLVALGCAVVARRAGLGDAVALVAAAASWAAPLALVLLGDAGGHWAGSRGRHE